jgi:hypothetical protein
LRVVKAGDAKSTGVPLPAGDDGYTDAGDLCPGHLIADVEADIAGEGEGFHGADGTPLGEKGGGVRILSPKGLIGVRAFDGSRPTGGSRGSSEMAKET